MYEVGRLWEFNRISLAKEHLVTAITEGLLNLAYPRLFEKTSVDSQNEKKVVISCAANEFNQAFNWGGTEIIKQYSGTAYVPSIDRLTPLIAA